MSNNTDYRSPAATHSSYASADPTAAPLSTSTSGVAYSGHPANAVTVSDPNFSSSSTTTSTTGAHPHHHHHGHHGSHPATTSTTAGHTTHPNNATETPNQGRTGEAAHDTQRLVKTGEYTTGLEPAAAAGALGPTPVPVLGNSHQERITGAPAVAGPAQRADAGPIHDTHGAAGLPAAAGRAGPLGGAVMLGGQCECIRTAGKCECGVGQCKCRGCSTGATVVNPGINIGVSDTQNHTAAQGGTAATTDGGRVNTNANTTATR